MPPPIWQPEFYSDFRKEASVELPVDKIVVSKNLRTDSMGDLEALAESFRRHGIIQPLIVDANHRLLCGYRRLAAAKLAGLETVPVRILEGPVTDGDLLELQLIENSYRQDLGPVERARTYKELIDEHGLSVGEVATLAGVSTSTVQVYLHFLADLAPESLAELANGELSPSNAIHLCRLDFETQRRILPQAISLTHGELQALVRRIVEREERQQQRARERAMEDSGEPGRAEPTPAEGTKRPAAPAPAGDIYDALLERGESTLAVLVLHSVITVVQAQKEVLMAQRRARVELDTRVEMSPDLKRRLVEVVEESVRLARDSLQGAEELHRVAAAKAV
jgi:ParB/RepB/Spo0J family partition protein